jgi:hypothetical protein
MDRKLASALIAFINSQGVTHKHRVSSETTKTYHWLKVVTELGTSKLNCFEDV